MRDRLPPIPVRDRESPGDKADRDRHDIIGQAKTGTGKTLGFGIPVLEDIIVPDEDGYDELLNPGKPQALIVLPTRELTKQVATDLRNAAKYLNTRIVDIYGGVAFEPQSLNANGQNFKSCSKLLFPLNS